jgi:hypothetical protein
MTDATQREAMRLQQSMWYCGCCVCFDDPRLIATGLSSRGTDKRRTRAIVFVVVIEFLCSRMCCGFAYRL